MLFFHGIHMSDGSGISTSDSRESVTANVLWRDSRFEAVNMKHPRIAVFTAPLWRKAIRLERENTMSEAVAKALERTRVLRVV